MKLPDAIFAKVLAGFDVLIAEGQNILQSATDVPPVVADGVGWEATREAWLCSGELRVPATNPLVEMSKP